MKPVFDELKSEFEKASGHKLSIAYGTAGAVKQRVAAGEVADVVVVLRPMLDELVKAG
jgi:molybdate transport system substrate-binding protein